MNKQKSDSERASKRKEREKREERERGWGVHRVRDKQKHKEFIAGSLRKVWQKECMCVCGGRKKDDVIQAESIWLRMLSQQAPEDTDTCVSDQQYPQGTCIPGDDTKEYWQTISTAGAASVTPCVKKSCRWGRDAPTPPPSEAWGEGITPTTTYCPRPQLIVPLSSSFLYLTLTDNLTMHSSLYPTPTLWM